MRKQLLEFYPDSNPSHVHVTGTPQFDFHVRPEFRWSREKTLERLGLKSGDRYILYAANSYHVTPTEPELVEELARRCEHAPELQTHRIVVRLHPQDDFSRWEGFATREERIIVNWPSTQSWNFSSPDDQASLVSTLLHADVCHNMWSTMSLDAAAVDTPVICVAFAGRRGTLEDKFCRMAYEADYYRPIVASGGVRMARDMDQLVVETIAYVSNRSRDEEERRQLVAEECGPLDGRSTTRIADLIESIVAEYQD